MNIDYVAVYNKPPSGSGSGGSGGSAGTGNTGGSAGTTSTTNLALGKSTTASSAENSGTEAANATDGNSGTRWSSAFSDPQWLQIDLGQSYAISHVTLNWENAYATSYQIQTSQNGTSWTTIYSTSSGDGGIDDLAVTGTGRYIRMYGTTRATQYGYSLWEFTVNGTPSSANPGSCNGNANPAATLFPIAWLGVLGGLGVWRRRPRAHKP
jgi:hypothetical protein